MEAERQRFVAAEPHSGRTVLAALRTWLPGQSWSDLRKLLAARRVLINAALCLDEARRLAIGEVVEISGRAQAAPPTADDVRLVWLDDELVVVDKPAGMITLRHPSERDWSSERKRRQPALDDVIPELIARQQHRGRKVTAPVFSVHRIDRGTSGLLVFARQVPAQQVLIEQFKKHSVERTYLAVARGTLAAQTFESRLVDDRGDGLRGSTSASGAGKRAVTHVRPIERLGGWTLLECRLETGRTHQIRIHLSEAGHPVYGDSKYGRPPAANELPTSRLALHATTLGFDHPTAQRRLSFESRPPRDFDALVAALRARPE
ncbi:MAG TPA: RluA family pseudouridine synthase [Planctomycetaceae bacterium]|nr:RluA family pseudouridine synthase [Planctomycetaceae bacterium]